MLKHILTGLKRSHPIPSLSLSLSLSLHTLTFFLKTVSLILFLFLSHSQRSSFFAHISSVFFYLLFFTFFSSISLFFSHLFLFQFPIPCLFFKDPRNPAFKTQTYPKSVGGLWEKTYYIRLIRIKPFSFSLI